MTTLYIDRSGAELRMLGQSVEIRTSDNAPMRLPLAHVSTIVIYGQATLTTGFLSQCWSRRISVQLLSGRRSEPTARFDGATHNDARLRLAQTAVHLDDFQRRKIATLVLRAKLVAQQRYLSSMAAPRGHTRKLSLAALTTIARASSRLRSCPPELDVLRGLEGAAAAAYFRAFCQHFPPSLNFKTRKRRPPPDPVNAALSLAYTLATTEAARALSISGFDPAIGFLHDLAHGRPALALDLVEPLRPMVDAMVLNLFRERVLTAKHFTTEPGGAVLLGKAGRSHFYEAWEQQRPALAQRARHYTRKAARLVRNSND